jgi:GntR family transcriptional regulator
MLLHLTDLSSEPIHKQISRQLTEKILAGDLAAGEKLPPPRSLARTQHVNVHAVERAYNDLQAESLITINSGAGVLVNALSPEKKHAIAMQMLAGEQSPLNIVKAVSEELISAFEPARLAGIFTANLKRHLLADRIYFAMFDAQAKKYAILSSENSADSYENRAGRCCWLEA